MPKRATTFELALPPRGADTPAWLWLCTALRAEILEGRLRPGARLPATRDLAGQHGLSRGTIVNAFEQLKSEGYLRGSVGAGTYVNEVLPDECLEVRKAPRPRPPEPRKPRREISGFARRARPVPAQDLLPARAFRAHQPALDLFPTTLWAQVASRRLRRASMTQLLGCDPLGYEPLREALADHLRASRGVKCEAGQVAILSGVQEALDLTARVLLNPGDRVALEDPGYSGAAIAFEAAGAKVAAVPVDGEGLDPRSPELHGARLVYVTPGHQFPLGITMSLPRRLELLEWARRSGALLFEDDYDGEYRYSGRPVPALQGLDRDGRVLYAGSFSKVLFPSLRLGYLIVPPDLVDAFAAAKSVSSRHAPVLEQAVLCDFITAGHFGRHLRRMREIYAGRLASLLEHARRRLAGLLEITGVEAGLQTAGWLPAGTDARRATKAAARRNVEVSPIRFSNPDGHPREALQLGFAAVDVPEIRRGVEDLAIALVEELS